MTGSPELAVAVTVKSGSTVARAGNGANEIVWSPGSIVNDRTTSVQPATPRCRPEMQ